MSEGCEALIRRIGAVETKARRAIPAAEWFRPEDLKDVSNIDGAAAALIVAANPAFLLELCEWARLGLASKSAEACKDPMAT